jgi:hypothetical protein
LRISETGMPLHKKLKKTEESVGLHPPLAGLFGNF